MGSARLNRSLNWYRAITLSERISLIRTTAVGSVSSEVDVDLATWYIRQWRSQPPFDTEPYFRQRLEVADLTENELFRLAGMRPEALRFRMRAAPAWLADIEAAFSPASVPDREPVPIPDASKSRTEFRFLNIIDPLIARRRERIAEGIKRIARQETHAPFDPSRIEEILLVNLPAQLVKALSPAVVLELNIARLQGLLDGATTDQRFENFLKRACQPSEALVFLSEYPVLARQIINLIDRSIDTGLEFLHRLCHDWGAIRAKFSPDEEPGLLTELRCGMGDTHRGGRSVMIAKFSSGFQVVYKPRSLSVDVHFQRLLEWLNHRGDHPPFRTLEILERRDYGWVEFVAAETCASMEESRRFYQRQGGYIALLYILEAVDFHYENLIAAGEHPVLVDLETLFHPRVQEANAGRPELLAGETMSRSVLRIGLLPQRRWVTEDSDGIDLSGLGAEPGQVTPFDIPYWDKPNSDEMHLAYRRGELPTSNNRPSLNGENLDVINYAEEILSGFTDIFRLIEKYRDELLADDGPLANFVDDEIRVIFRPTQKYSVLLEKSFHPDLLGNAIARDLYFDRLWSGHELNPHLIKIVAEEQDDLLDGDIPMFTARPGSCDLWSSRKKRMVGFFDEPSISIVQRRIRHLNELELAQQLWFIQASLATVSTGSKHIKRPTYSPQEALRDVDEEQLLKAACAVGDRLEEMALRGDSNLTWIGLSLSRRGNRLLAPLGIDLYDGLPGIAMFLAYLGNVTGENRYSDMAQDVTATVERMIDRRKQSLTKIGCFDGWGGVIYMLTHLGALWSDRRLFVEADRVVEFLATHIDKDPHFDIISGAAGCIMALLSFHYASSSDRALATAIRCGDHLLSHAQHVENGVGWKTFAEASEPSTGFAHGAAGIAMALTKVDVVSGEERFRKIALSAFDYERSSSLTESGPWADSPRLESRGFKEKNSEPGPVTTWCHGAPGKGIACLASLRFLNNPAIRREITEALETTMARGFGANHCLCHGDLGSLEFLLQASRAFDDRHLSLQLERRARLVFGSITTDGWLCGIPLNIQSPGLMTGIAGIGYGLLRLAEPSRVPSILALEPPLFPGRGLEAGSEDSAATSSGGDQP